MSRMLIKRMNIRCNKYSKHDSLIHDLESRLVNSPIMYDAILTNLEYRYGEIDLIAVKGKYTIIVETKTNYSKKNYRTAMNQLQRIKDRFISDKQRVWYFYQCSANNETGYKLEKVNIP